MRRALAIAAVVGLGTCLGAVSVAAVEDAALRALDGHYTGFGRDARGGADGPVLEVTTLADAGPGSLRDALDRARAAGGGTILFALGGDVVLESALAVPANTTLDALSAPHPGITLWGDTVGGGGGVVNVFESNVIVRGLRVRNAANDGIQIAPKRGQAISDVVVDHCSVTNSADGGIDVTGRDGLTVRNVTLSWNYVAGSGSACSKGTCGGGALVKYGVDRVSVHANHWDKNLRRTPSVHGADVPEGTLADVRGNVVSASAESAIQVVAGARANVVDNHLDPGQTIFVRDGFVYASGNQPGGAGNVAVPFAVTAPLSRVARADVVLAAGAQPPDPVDDFYRHQVATWAEVKAITIAPGDFPAAPGPTATAAPPPPTPSPAPPAPTPVPRDGGVGLYPLPDLPPNPVDLATLAEATELARAARKVRGRRAARQERTEAAYAEVMRMLQGATGPLAPAAHELMAHVEHRLALLARKRPARDYARALQHARAGVAHCEVDGCGRRTTKRVARQLRRATRDLERRRLALPPWLPPVY